MEGLLTLFVALTAAAVMLQAGILLSLYLLSKRVVGQIELTLGQLRDLMPSLKTVTDNLKTVSEDVVEVGHAAREQVHNIEEMIGETTFEEISSRGASASSLVVTTQGLAELFDEARLWRGLHVRDRRPTEPREPFLRALPGAPQSTHG